MRNVSLVSQLQSHFLHPLTALRICLLFFFMQCEICGQSRAKSEERNNEKTMILLTLSGAKKREEKENVKISTERRDEMDRAKLIFAAGHSIQYLFLFHPIFDSLFVCALLVN